MTFTPDRKRRKSRKRVRRANPGPRVSGPGDVTAPNPAGDSSANTPQQAAPLPEPNADPSPSSLSEQLKAAGLDLTGHELADYFNTLDPVPADDDAANDEIPDAEKAADPETEFEPVPSGEPTTSAEQATAGRPEPSIESVESDDATGSDESVSPFASPHPLLTDETWNDLARFAPEVTGSLAALMSLDHELRTFDRPMGPAEAMGVCDQL